MTLKSLGGYILSGSKWKTSLVDIFKALPVEGEPKLRLLHRIHDNIASEPQAEELIRKRAERWLKAQDLHALNLLAVEKEGEELFLISEHRQGRLLSLIMAKSREEKLPLATDQAVYLAERIAGGLASLAAQKITCSCLSPERILVTFEGEIKLLPCVFVDLQTTSAGAIPDLAPTLRYLPPEAATGKTTPSSSDVYSLGALFFEFLTGEVFRASDKIFDPGARLAKARMSGAETIPASLMAILKKSLLPHYPGAYKSINPMKGDLDQLISSGEYSPTTFNMAFLMHSLFRGEDEAEAQDDEALVKTDRTPFAKALEAAKKAAEVPRVSEALPHAVPVKTKLPAAYKKKEMETGGGKKIMLVAGGVVAAIVIVVLAVWLIFFRGNGPSKATLRAEQQLALLKVQRARSRAQNEEMAGKLQAIQDEKKALQNKVGKATTAKEKRHARRMPAAANQNMHNQQRKATSKKATPAPVGAPSRSAAPPAAVERTKTATGSPAKGSVAAAVPKTTKAKALPPAETSKPTAKSPSPRKSKKPTIKVGDFVESWALDVQPRRLNKLKIFIPGAARRHRIHGTVWVQVYVDETGVVSGAKVMRGLIPDYGLNDACRQAALKLKYAPAMKDGVAVKTNVTFPIAIK